jgi:hypothetical protein
VVESRTELVDAFSDDDRPSDVWDQVDPSEKRNLPGLWVGINSHSVVGTLKSRGGLGVERLHVLVCPVELGVDTIGGHVQELLPS